jgi:hypothetical protein
MSSREDGGSTVAVRVFPIRLIEESFLGFNILQYGLYDFVALGQSEGEFLPEKLAQGGYQRSFVGTSAAAVKAEVVAELLVDTLARVASREIGLRSVYAGFRRYLEARRRSRRVKLAEARYQGFNLFEAAPGRFVALMDFEGPYRPDKTQPSYEGGSLDDIKSKIGDVTIRMVTSNHQGFSILQLGPKRFVAVPNYEGPYRPAQRKPAYEGETVADIEGQIGDLDVTVRLMEENYQGFNLVKVGPTVIAVAQSDGDYHPDKVAPNLRADSVAELKTKLGTLDARVKLVETGYRGFNLLERGRGTFVAWPQSAGDYRSGTSQLSYEANSIADLKAKIGDTDLSVSMVAVHRGHNILSLGRDRYLALHGQEGPYDADKLARQEYRHAYVASSLDGAKALVDAAFPPQPVWKRIPSALQRRYRAIRGSKAVAGTKDDLAPASSDETAPARQGVAP